jgi:hypothetical protein
MPKVYIAIFTPHYGNFLHWAIFIQTEPPLVLEVAGEHPNFIPNVICSSPDLDVRHIRNIEVGEVREDEMSQIRSFIEATYVDNETVEWTCQDYVLEALEKLGEECLLDEDDEQYQKAIRMAKRQYFGPQ